jgi:hypothetical protein
MPGHRDQSKPNPDELHMRDQGVGAVIGKLLVDNHAGAIGYAGEPCAVAAPGGNAARLVLGRNDVGTGTGPYGGAFGTGTARVTLNWGSGAFLVGTCIAPPVVQGPPNG